MTLEDQLGGFVDAVKCRVSFQLGFVCTCLFGRILDVCIEPKRLETTWFEGQHAPTGSNRLKLNKRWAWPFLTNHQS